jgi:hypothetical protein
VKKSLLDRCDQLEASVIGLSFPYYGHTSTEQSPKATTPTAGCHAAPVVSIEERSGTQYKNVQHTLIFIGKIIEKNCSR